MSSEITCFAVWGKQSANEEAVASVENTGDQADLKDVPSPQEILRGMSSEITCFAVCETRHVIFAGTVEGRVLAFAITEGFPVIRWFNNMNDTSAVTCICFSEQSDLLLVGTMDGIVHLYALGSLRSAGAINIPRVLPEKGENEKLHHPAIRHLRVVPLTLQTNLPVTVVTIDKHSKIRIWALVRNHRTGKLEELACLFDSGVLLGKQCMPGAPKASEDGTEVEHLEHPVAFTAVTAFTCPVPLIQENASTMSRQRTTSMLEEAESADSPASSPKVRKSSGS